MDLQLEGQLSIVNAIAFTTLRGNEKMAFHDPFDSGPICYLTE